MFRSSRKIQSHYKADHRKIPNNANSNQWTDSLPDFVVNYNSSYHRNIKNNPERLEIFDEGEVARWEL